MATHDERWAAYFYDGTSVLRNKHGLRDSVELRKIWYENADLRIKELELKPLKPASGTADLDYMRAVHRYINQDTFTWAGELRNVNMAKRGEPRSPFTAYDQIEARATRVTVGYIQQKHFEGLDKPEFVGKLAEFAEAWNHLHPFREGNGRANKVFLEHVCQRAGYHLQLDRVDSARWNGAFQAGAAEDMDPLREMFGDAVRPLRAVAFEVLDEAESVRRYPELSQLHTHIRQAADKAREAGMPLDQIQIVTGQLRARIVETLDTGRTFGNFAAITGLERLQALNAYTRGKQQAAAGGALLAKQAGPMPAATRSTEPPRGRGR